MLKKELEENEVHLSDHESAGQRARKFIKIVDSYCDFNEITPTAINEFISKLVVHERDMKGHVNSPQHVEVHFNYIGTFVNDITQPTEEEIERLKAEQAQAKREKELAWRREWSREYRARDIEKWREYERMKAREYRAKRKLNKAEQAAI